MRERVRPVVIVGAVFVVVAAAAVACLTSCDKSADAPEAGVIKLSSAEVASLLGIKESDGVKIGDVESGKDGVKVKTISLRDGGSTEVEIADVELRITSSAKLVYAIAYLKLGKLDVLDWKSSQRAQAFDVRVDKPGDGFLTKLQAAITNTRAGGVLKTSELSCEGLSIDRIDYVLRAADAILTKVSIEKLTIARATTASIGEFGIGRAAIGDHVTGRGLKVGNVDRRWADRLLALLTQAAAQVGGTTRPTTASATRPLLDAPDLAAKLLPFDRIEVAEFGADLGKLFRSDAALGKVANLRIDVQRNPAGQFTGLTGRADLALETKVFGKEGLKFFQDMGNPALATSLGGTLELKMVVDPDQRTERSTVTVVAPGLLGVTVDATTRQLASTIGTMIVQQRLPERDEDGPLMSALTLEGREDGLVAFMLSPRFEQSESFRTALQTFPFKQKDVAEEGRLREEMSRFLKAPGGATWANSAGSFLPMGVFLRDMDRATSTAITARFSFSGKPGTPYAAPQPPSEASLQADYAGYQAARVKRVDERFVAANAFDKFAGWRRAADAGNSTAQLLVGECYQKGVGVREDKEQAMRYYRTAAEAGETAAMCRIGATFKYRYGTDKLPDHAEAMRWFSKAAGLNDVHAMWEVGNLYSGYSGYGVPTDHDKAMMWYKLAAEGGNTAAWISMGDMYANGNGVTTDYAEALRCYRQAADAGDASAMSHIAERYEQAGFGGPPDRAEALRWFRKAAAAGDSYAKYRAGRLEQELAK